MDEYWVDGLLAAQREGKKSDNNFKKEVWKELADKVNEKFKVNYSLEQLKNRYYALEKKYGVYKALREASGFGYDPTTGLVTAPDNVWDKYIQVL